MEHPRTPGNNPGDWPTTDNPILGHHEVHVWQSTLAVPDSDIRRYESWLSRDERQRANRFRLDHDRRRFIVRRGVVRAILGQDLGAPPGGRCAPALLPQSRRRGGGLSKRLPARAEDMAAERVLVQNLLHLHRQPVHPLAHVGGAARQVDRQTVKRGQHCEVS